ncbi:Peptidoglycan O-acetyltransferase [Falsiruegeria litorea R37]|uniref:Probable alginate O-acetylase AlgI n=1 Tax=Falsiruegeria litorea R37 TaxID=1200284 RepID=A0A1Y5TVV9_9RHOB|nr:MBOAT family O-acyltransferase [Falsiruegeria litorea]SLN71462.1 Peptidoglycan O-acetyltransferase [Falsiruegeria litorea R37]
MLFASLPFLLGFLPAVLIATYAMRRGFGPRGALAALTIASLVFYGWYHPPFLALLLGSVGANFFLAHRIAARPTRLLTGTGVAFNLGLLGWYKYAGFFDDIARAVSGSGLGIPEILLPLGISFFTFQQIAYLVDIHQGKAKPGDALEYLFFVSFFPQLIAGPIVHHRDMIPQLSQPRFAMFKSEDIASGLVLFCIGLAKKVLIADGLAPGADAMFQAQSLGIELSLAEAWLGMLCYTFQIYFDFSGYADMALGLGLLFGLKLPVNFNSPYKSTDIIEFWRRWHITLSTFLRDYLYIPFGGSRHGPVRRYANLWIVMLLGGLWHGAGWQFVVWGGLHGAYLTAAHFWRANSMPKLSPKIGFALTFAAVVIAWVFFCAETVHQAFAVLHAMFGATTVNYTSVVVFPELNPLLVTLLLAMLLAFFAPNSIEISKRLETPSIRTSRSLWYAVGGCIAALSLTHLYSSGSHAFIYFQF